MIRYCTIHGKTEFYDGDIKYGGKAHTCVACNRARARVSSVRTNPKTNAVSALVYEWAGGSKKFYELPREERLSLREKAKGYLEGVERDNEPIVRPKFTREASVYSELTEQEQRIKDERVAAYTAQDNREGQRREGSVYCIVLRESPQATMFKGWVCKIGYAGIVKDREQECDRWSIDGKEWTAWRFEHANARWLEAEVHRELRMRGKHRRKEVFNVSPREAWDVLKTILSQAGYTEEKINAGKREGNRSDSGHRGQRVPPCRGHDMASQYHGGAE